MQKKTRIGSNALKLHLVFLADVYAKDPIALLKEQSSSSTKEPMIAESLASHAFSHHMNFELGTHAAKAADQYLKRVQTKMKVGKALKQMEKN